MLPVLLGIFSLILMAGTAQVIFFRLPRIQDALREMAQQTASGLSSGLTGQTPDYTGIHVSHTLTGNAWLMSAAFLGFMACWFLLIYRVAENSRRAGGSLMRMSPEECILSFFLPVVNLWKPLQALLNINTVLSPGNRKGGAALIWTAWAVSVPGALLVFLYTLFMPLITFMKVFQGWNEDQDILTTERMGNDLQSVFLSMAAPILYNGTLFLLSILLSTLMVFYLDFRSRKMHPFTAE